MSPTPAAGAVPEAMGTGEPLLLRALTGERTASPPVWFMRQAGRSLPEYRALRVGTRMLEACLTPDLAAEITVQPVRRHGVDAAIFFSDIVVPLRLAGVEVEIEPGRGPVFADPVRTAADVDRLTRIDPDDVAAAGDPVAVAVRTVVRELGPSVPVIGFAGAPFTLASYLVEGGPSKDQLRARAMMHADPAAWDRLAGWLAQVARAFLAVQTGAGARAVQLFDSWAGTLSADDYRRSVAPHSRAALAGVEAPRVHFGVNTGHLLAEMRLEGTASAVGVDWRTPLDEAVGVLGPEAVVQGNIDPALLRAPWSVLEAHVADVVRRGSTAAAHILNLGHGVPPDTDPDVLTRIVEFVHGRMP